LSKSLCTKGAEFAEREMRRLMGDSFEDFRMVDDGFEGDCYAFVRCHRESLENYMGAFRKSSVVVAVLESYDNPTFLSDSEVLGFADEEDEENFGTRYGDMVLVSGGGHYSGLHGVVVEEGLRESEVLFRFHTVIRREILSNEELILEGNVFTKFKVPVTNVALVELNGKFPLVMEE
jgi:hypothetical protein